MDKIKDVMREALTHWLTASRLAHDAQEEYTMAIREKKDSAVIAALRDRMLGWKGVEDGATGMYRSIKKLDQEDSAQKQRNERIISRLRALDSEDEE